MDIREQIRRWTDAEAELDRGERARDRALSDVERMRLVAQACRTARRLVDLSHDPARALAWVDPLPESTIRALERLRGARAA